MNVELARGGAGMDPAGRKLSFLAIVREAVVLGGGTPMDAPMRGDDGRLWVD